MVAVPEWDAGGLAPVMQTFVGHLDVFDHSPRLCTASDKDNVSMCDTLAFGREMHGELEILSLSISFLMPF